MLLTLARSCRRPRRQLRRKRSQSAARPDSLSEWKWPLERSGAISSWLLEPCPVCVGNPILTQVRKDDEHVLRQDGVYVTEVEDCVVPEIVTVPPCTQKMGDPPRLARIALSDF